MSQKNKKPSAICACGASRTYETCCAPYHQGALAPTPEALMRSRYSAYVLALYDYLRATWATETCPSDLGDDGSEKTKWLGLSIVGAWAGAHEREGFVEFIAKYKVGGTGAQRLHEVSRFIRSEVDGRWLYVDGVFPESDEAVPRQ